MNQSRSTYHSKLYREFRSIEASEWRTVIRFYKEYEGKLKGLEFEEYFEILLAYTNALFETGAHREHLKAADEVIETSMMNNVKFFNGDDVLQNTLFKKAASCFQTHQLEKADYLLRELLRIDPYDEDGALFLKSCLRKMRSDIVKKARAVSLFLLLMSALLICVEVLLVRRHYPIYTDLVVASRNSTLFLSVMVMLGAGLYHRMRTDREVENFVEHLKKRKK
ncbi:MAG TPA: hypothetical protein ENJ95_02840 [Bacteroidetes bacterium]|nr:hypothetical protein [Bacteroidota bacterium]